eukprot:scaffold3827_cov394-Prasinococcus_capsulatus_cf.AAC.3
MPSSSQCDSVRLGFGTRKLAVSEQAAARRDGPPRARTLVEKASYKARTAVPCPYSQQRNCRPSSMTLAVRRAAVACASGCPGCFGHRRHDARTAVPLAIRRASQSRGMVLCPVVHTLYAQRSSTSLKRAVCCQASGADSNSSPDFSVTDWIAKNEGRVRAAPIQLGTLGLALAAVNRIVFVLNQEAATPAGAAARRLAAAAEGSQTRADVLCVAASATLILTGLVWKSVQARKPVEVDLRGTQPDASSSTHVGAACLGPQTSIALCRRGMPGDRQGNCRWHSWLRGGADVDMGDAPEIDKMLLASGVRQGPVRAASRVGASEISADIGMLGKVTETAQKNGKGNYLANLANYPGRFEFFGYFPDNTQGVLVQPIGTQGLIVAGTNVVRGFGRVDQKWIATISDKLDATLDQDLETPDLPDPTKL